jgi:hypothetical protein
MERNGKALTFLLQGSTHERKHGHDAIGLPSLKKKEGKAKKYKQ